MWLAGMTRPSISCGKLDGHVPGDTWIVSYEDTAAEVLRPRVEAAGGRSSASASDASPSIHRGYVEPVA
jgi:hypothetical protein